MDSIYLINLYDDMRHQNSITENMIPDCVSYINNDVKGNVLLKDNTLFSKTTIPEN